MIFGGFDQNQTVSNEVSMLVDKKNGEYSIRVFQDKGEEKG